MCVHIYVIPSTCPMMPLSLSIVSFLSPANILSLQRQGFPAFGRRIVMARAEARGELTAHGTKQDATIEHCIHGEDDTREREGVRGRRRAQKRESKRVGSSGTKARGVRQRRQRDRERERESEGGETERERESKRERERERTQRHVVARGGDYRAVNHPR